MKTVLPEESRYHAQDIYAIRDIIVKYFEDRIAGIILYGSFARGDWQLDRANYFASDYDLLIITKTGRQGTGYQAMRLEDAINARIERHLKPKRREHDASVIIESLDHVNEQLEKGRYFFSDIKKEGILLYAMDGLELKDKRTDLTNEEIREMAEEDFGIWFPNGASRLKMVPFFIQQKDLNFAAFLLHQSAEALLNCSLLVLTAYLPRTHNLHKLRQLCASQSNAFLDIFPRATKEQRVCFDLLQKAYLDARYSKHYTITEDQLEYLIERVTYLKEVTEKVCKERIESL